MKVKLLKEIKKVRVVRSLLLGIITSWLIKDFVTMAILAGKDFNSRSIFAQIGILAILILITSPFFFIFLLFVNSFSDQKFLKLIKYKIEQFNPSPFNQLLIVMITTGLLFVILQTLLIKVSWSPFTWSPIESIPSGLGIGGDFQAGLNAPGQCLLRGGIPYVEDVCLSAYPPFSFLFGMLFSIFSTDFAYKVMLFIIYGTMIGSLYLVYKIVIFIFEDLTDQERLLVLFLETICGVIILNGYPFEFAVQRGNNDCIVIFLSLLAFWTFLKNPKKIWQVVFYLSMASQLKVYPIILFVVFFFYYKKSLILPLLAINLPLCLCLGPQAFLNYIKFLTEFSNSPFLWIGNHSTASFVHLITLFPSEIHAPLSWNLIFLIILVVPWMALLLDFFIFQTRESLLDYLLLFIVTLPLTCIIPSVSHDYKLVFLIPGMLLFLATTGLLYLKTGKPIWRVFFGINSILFLLISQSPLAIFQRFFPKYPESSLFDSGFSLPIWGVLLANKYPFIAGFELLVVYACLLYWGRKEIVSIPLPKN